MSAPEYVFPRDYPEYNRINAQHHLWIQLFGLWLTDLNDKLPSSVRLDGFDISLKGAPPAAYLPKNVTMRHWDIKQEPPADLVGVYDIMQVRIFSLVLLGTEVKPAIERLMKCLKPGGYLQWGENDMHSLRLEKSDPNAKTDGLERFKHMQTGLEEQRLTMGWGPELATAFRESGLESVQEDAREPPPHIAWPLHQQQLFVIDLLLRPGLLPESEWKTLGEAVKESHEGSIWFMTRRMVIGRKPINR